MPEADRPPRVLAISHAAVIAINQEPFDALARAGFDVTIVAPSELRTDLRGTVKLEPLRDGIAKLAPLRVVLGGNRPSLGGQRGIHLITYEGLRRVMTETYPDVVFVEEEPFSLAAGQATRYCDRLNVPFVVHENQNIDRTLPPPFGAVRRFVLNRAAGATVRNGAAEGILRAHRFTRPVARLPHAVDPARFDGNARATDLPEPVIGFVGRLVAEKGIVDLIVAIEQAGIGSLLVVGDGPARGEAEARARRIPARFVGAVPHDAVPAWYASMDLVAIPSRTTSTWMEQFGRIVIEANAARVPVIATDSGALPETIEATGGGVVVPEGDVGALADAIAALCKDPDRRSALGAAGRAAVEDRFTPAAVARTFGAFLRGVAR